MKYLLLLRGINVGGRHKVVMADLRVSLEKLGYSQVSTYINSGNILLTSDRPVAVLEREITDLLAQKYDFPLPFILIAKEDYLAEKDSLPTWWQEDLERKNVLFYTRETDPRLVQEDIAGLNLRNELVHFGKLAVYWGEYNRNSAYAEDFIKRPAYKQVTIRNANTFHKLAQLLQEEG
ncbi:DUF1697 domain-containing protein [Streptococcus oricebi]|uniref:Phosphopentomutase n=1 Tax=Streptococcus oricebi TaxID=1547447 RepID=A0ABS5B0Q1_9STRE|nr:DUF1697 domain-containing protein [Streptococcus oricebi]MBP2622403.1 phosphopentomutase [Streptococcus oricebi]